MTQDDRPRLSKLLAVFGETFQEAVSDLRAEAYFVALCDIPIEALERAGLRHMRESRFFPKPVELRDFADPGWRRREENTRILEAAKAERRKLES